MSFVGLFLSGAVLFLNSLMLLGKAEAKSVGVFNIFIGIIQIIIPSYLMFVSGQNNWELYNVASIFLFGLTYLYVGVTVLKGLDGSGLGWFSLWVAIIAVVYTLTSIIHFHDVVNALTWGMWALLWFLFFLSNALKKKIDTYIGIVAFVQSWVTLTIPALLYFLGVWDTRFVSQIWTLVLILAIVYFVVSLFKMKFSFKKEKSGQEVQVI
ncbi:AmiS/UreI family transporter [Bacillus sp. ISL-40]|uniref:AmiS/UreI family transporter n=1 Tax=unclassified Bacillus (in: firmicutes) TaxID=185979 RepID=UPI001BEB7612|nr:MULTISPECIES: AmiS/UreI family transporter [unclassified Bacillus (in: firmicutes)]MBT2701476.1 AmiS/UreI family transporter [Bacillus sp. ISL-40]MBT2720839.1 AmiS/UreI family transporter [Bacillus sp. ISL-46]MBT2743723.1 AmiS/UreI family transporter [Bacillus sp. ISL-77]